MLIKEPSMKFELLSVSLSLLDYQPNLFHVSNKLKDSIYFNAYKKYLFYDKPVVVKSGSRYKVLSNFEEVEMLKAAHAKRITVYVSADIKTHEQELLFTVSRLQYKEKSYEQKFVLIKFMKEIYSVYPDFFLSLLPPKILKEASKSTDAKVGAVLSISKSTVNNIERIGNFNKKLLLSLDKGEISFYAALGTAITGELHPNIGKLKKPGKLFVGFPESGKYKIVLIDRLGSLLEGLRVQIM